MVRADYPDSWKKAIRLDNGDGENEKGRKSAGGKTRREFLPLSPFLILLSVVWALHPRQNTRLPKLALALLIDSSDDPERRKHS